MKLSPFTTALVASALTLTAAPLHAADDAKAAAPKGDLARFQGKWTSKFGPNQDLNVAFNIEDKNVTLKVTLPDGQEFEVKGELVVDGDTKPHKTLTWTKFTNGQGEDIADNLGIYTLEDADTIKICSGGPGKDRPTEFKNEEGGPTIAVLKRDKPKAEETKDKPKAEETKDKPR